MLHKVRKFKTFFVLIGLVSMWLLLIQALPATDLDASNWLPALLTFQSPIGNPAFALNKTSNNPAPKTGETIIYTVAYSNTNLGSQAFNVRLYDFLPAGVSLLYTTPPYNTYEHGVLVFNAPTVGPGQENIEITIAAQVREGYAGLNNQALVTADGITPTYASLLSTIHPPRRELTLSKTGYDVALKNSEIVYQLRCENTGDIGLHNIVMLDVLPSSLTYQSATPPPASTTPILQWNVGDLNVGQVWITELHVTAPDETMLLTNTLIATSEQLTPTTTVFATRVISEGAILLLTKTSPTSEAFVGDDVIYTLAYENIGNMTATTTLLTDTYPADITVTGFDPTPDTSTAAHAIWQLGTIAAGESGQVVISTTVGGTPGRILRNTADIDSVDPAIFGEQAILDIDVILYRTYLPLIMRR